MHDAMERAQNELMEKEREGEAVKLAQKQLEEMGFQIGNIEMLAELLSANGGRSSQTCTEAAGGDGLSDREHRDAGRAPQCQWWRRAEAHRSHRPTMIGSHPAQGECAPPCIQHKRAGRSSLRRCAWRCQMRQESWLHYYR